MPQRKFLKTPKYGQTKCEPIILIGDEQIFIEENYGIGLGEWTHLMCTTSRNAEDAVAELYRRKHGVNEPKHLFAWHDCKGHTRTTLHPTSIAHKIRLTFFVDESSQDPCSCVEEHNFRKYCHM